MTHRGRRTTFLLIMLVGLAACASPGRQALPSSPLFVPELRDASRYQMLAREQDFLLATCGETHTCDRVHFTRALVALYESQALAARHFQDVIDVAPRSHLAASSQFWLQFLQDPPTFVGRMSPYARAAELLVRDLLELESSSGMALHREVKARDRLVEDLTKQLDALKRVDQEMREIREKNRPARPSPKTPPPADGKP